MAVQAELDIHVVEAPTRKEADVEIARRIGKDLDSSAA